MTFEEQFPSLTSRWSDSEFDDDLKHFVKRNGFVSENQVMVNCLDKQKVREAIKNSWIITNEDKFISEEKLLKELGL